jgi:hypothetical protein
MVEGQISRQGCVLIRPETSLRFANISFRCGKAVPNEFSSWPKTCLRRWEEASKFDNAEPKWFSRVSWPVT